jgi:hypothetical protein
MLNTWLDIVTEYRCPESTMRRAALFALLTLITGLPGAAWAAEQAGQSANATKVELALHYDFLSDQVAKVIDLSGNEHAGTLRGGELVYGRRKTAVKLDGTGLISMDGSPNALNPACRPLTVGAFCQPAAPDGVLLAMGDKNNGFSLYLKAGVPQFAVRAQGRLFKIAARDPVVMDQWVHLAGAIDAQGNIWLIVNGWPGASVEGKLIPQRPAEPFCVGADPGSPVGEYATPFPWHGLVQDIRWYWGFMDRNGNRDEWGDWADLPGCGCKK